MKLDQAVECGAEGVEQLTGRGMILAQFFEHGARIFVGLEFGGDLLEVLLVLAQIGPADLEQLVERQIDHLVVLRASSRKVSAPMRKSPLERGSRSVLSQSR